ncbi:M61 family metallopeptidase [Ideonella sp. B7]|uniref:M61 family metallopeptidase n=1 Tax=Ideonella benzenivorans TaxID=2831643 RepID=UPI001CED1A0F|nr:PDZ domain-containing protein [Ideonella benzenivorans]MCA6216866.1 M61 family metallopeptidase [Ideonella benzenivorans]
MIQFRIDVADVATHRFSVTLTVPAPAAETTVSLPVWIPGSYLVREFGRHLSLLQARQGRQSRPLTQQDKSTWTVSCQGHAALVIQYEVYAFDASVRTAFLDDRRGFFNTTSLCLRVHGREEVPQQVQIGQLPKGWEVATAMPADAGEHTYVSADYDELADHPFELGRFWRGQFEAGGVPHEFVVAGAWPGFDGERLLADAKRICATQIAFWHGRRKPPFARYVFLLNAVEDGYGGLEHRASTALIAKRADLPRAGMASPVPEGYMTLLGLISHEYFHTWNVKRLKPVEFLRYDYTRENYTELLWFFEGFTSYYDDLLLVRAGLLDVPRYLKLLARTVNGVLATPGRQVQSVAEASFDAWVKYYRSDENTPNSTVSYYTKGSLVALLLDLRLRQAGSSLDVLMRALWARCLRTGLTEADVLAEVERLAGAALAGELQTWVHGRDELPLAEALTALGVQVGHESPAWVAALGLRLSEGPITGVQVKSVLRGSAAARAGVSAGDELLAVDGWRIRRLDDARQWLPPEPVPFELTLVRQQRLRTLTLRPEPHPAESWTLTLAESPAAQAQALALRKAWLGR